MKTAFRILVGKPEGRGQFGRTGRRWENIKMELEKTEWEGVDWIGTGGGLL
jgi:hypothetical protein